MFMTVRNLFNLFIFFKSTVNSVEQNNDMLLISEYVRSSFYNLLLQINQQGIILNLLYVTKRHIDVGFSAGHHVRALWISRSKSDVLLITKNISETCFKAYNLLVKLSAKAFLCIKYGNVSDRTTNGQL